MSVVGTVTKVTSTVSATVRSAVGAGSGGGTPAVPPTNTVAPVIAGTATIGSTLTYTAGTYTGDPTIVITRQWKRNGVAISGATGTSYVLVAADNAKAITLTETGTNDTGSDSADSNSIGLVYDSDAADYFTRVAGLSGGFDQTAINAAYTTDAVKSAISSFVIGCKADSIWTKLTEVYLLAGVNFAGLMAKLKHAGTAAMTNANFVTGDYVGAGSGTGLKGDKSSKYLSTSLGDFSSNSKSFGVYTTEFPSATFSSYVASRGDSSVPRLELGFAVTNNVRYYVPQSDAPMTVGSSTTGFHIATRRGTNDAEAYANGSSVATDTATADPGAGGEWLLFATQPTGGSLSSYSDGRSAFAFIGTGVTDTEAANLSTRVNALMTAIGANVY